MTSLAVSSDGQACQSVCVRSLFGNATSHFEAVRSVVGPGLVSCDSYDEMRHNSVAGELAPARYKNCSGNPPADPSLYHNRDHSIHNAVTNPSLDDTLDHAIHNAVTDPGRDPEL